MKKSYGQHFLHDKNIIAKIIAGVSIGPGEALIEVGPGAGALTEGLVDLAGGAITLIEADRDLIPSLHDRFPQAEIVHADAAMVDYDAITGDRPWVFVSNLPYNAGNAILEKIFTSKNPPRQLVVMVQKEVGERMMAKAGDMSVLSVATQLHCNLERLFIVKPGAFIPPPKVDSMVLRMTTRTVSGELSDRRLRLERDERVSLNSGAQFAQAQATCPRKGSLNSLNEDPRESIIALAKIGFAHRRKQLRQTLAQANVADLAVIDTAIESIGFPKTVRPQELNTADWVKLYSVFASAAKQSR